VKYRFL